MPDRNRTTDHWLFVSAIPIILIGILGFAAMTILDARDKPSEEQVDSKIEKVKSEVKEIVSEKLASAGQFNEQDRKNIKQMVKTNTEGMEKLSGAFQEFKETQIEQNAINNQKWDQILEELKKMNNDGVNR